uniref:ORF 65 n=1 Tax=Lactococcus phage mv4 TaxID=12392 RepID=Q9G0C4_BPMV4|nr:ORF 65 [Lactobacillus phage mv4]
MAIAPEHSTNFLRKLGFSTRSTDSGFSIRLTWARDTSKASHSPLRTERGMTEASQALTGRKKAGS